MIVNAPMPEGTGFSDKLCGNPLAWRLTGSSCREERKADRLQKGERQP